MKVICDYCGDVAKLVGGDIVYPHRPDLYELKFYVCEFCDARVGCHKGTKEPLGSLANGELRRLRNKAHSLFDPLWKEHGWTRTQAYQWLSAKMELLEDNCHIGMFSREQCKQVIEIMRELNGMQM